MTIYDYLGETMADKMETPAHLGESGAALWRDVAWKYGLRADELAVLLRACETADKIDAINAALAGQPLVVNGSLGQQREHPLLSEWRQQVKLQAALLAQLKLPNSAAPSASDASAAGRNLVRARYDKRLRSV
jgi:hypothetical protein